MRLYGYWRSSASYRVRIALNLKNIDYEYIPVHLVKDGGEQHLPDYKLLNPGELVPTLVDTENESDFILNQSLAIIEYLDELYPETNRLIPAHKLDRARVRMVAYDLACDTQPIQNLRVLQYLESHFNAGQDEKTAWVKHWIEGTFEAVEKRIQNTAADFCFGFNVSMADVVLVPQHYNAMRFGVDMEKYPLIHKVVENCNNLDAFQKAAPEAQPDAA